MPGYWKAQSDQKSLNQAQITDFQCILFVKGYEIN